MGNLWHPQPRNLSSGFDWLVFNLPDGLWAFGFMSFLIIICRNDTKLIRIVYYGIGFLLMMGHEAVQGTLLPGTFDPLDLLAIIIGIFSSWFLLS